MSKVALVEFNTDQHKALEQALNLIGGINDVNTPEKPVTLKVGIYHKGSPQHTSTGLVNAIIASFDRAPKIFLVESDNYCGTGLERLEVYKEFFSERVVPLSLSGNTDAENVRLAGMNMQLSPVLFKPNVLVDTHVMRTMKRGSILKNLFGCVPDARKAKFHKTAVFCPMLADIFEAVGGIDLAVLDGTRLFRTGSKLSVQTGTLVVGRDAVAVEAVGSFLGGVKPENNPVIQEFVRRGLGEGRLENIEVVGAPLEDVKRGFKAAVKALDRVWREQGGAPKSWSSEIDNLIKEGFFNLPNYRTREGVAKVLEARGIRVKGNTAVMVTTLNRRVKKGKLKTERRPDGWVYWAG